VTRVLAAYVAGIRPGDYLALLVFFEAEAGETALLAHLRQGLRDRLRVATTLGTGPRYLHSTGQLHKGGPPTGVFLMLTAETRRDLPVPDLPYSFGMLLDAQAIGDLESLVSKQRRVVRVHLEGPRHEALHELASILERAPVTHPA
jgi:hypothetical protein